MPETTAKQVVENAAEEIREAMRHLISARSRCDRLDMWVRNGPSDEDRQLAKSVVALLTADIGRLQDHESVLATILVNLGRQTSV